jgi:hypothetical protein
LERATAILVVGKDLIDALPDLLTTPACGTVPRLAKFLQHRVGPDGRGLLYQHDAAAIDSSRRLYDKSEHGAAGDYLPDTERHVIDLQALGLDRLLDSGRLIH